MTQTFAQRVKQLNLPAGEFVVIGSGLLDQLGIRKANDIDLVIDRDLYDKIKHDSTNWIEKTVDQGRQYLESTQFLSEIWCDLPTESGVMEFEDLIRHAEIHDSVTFVDLDFVRSWKVWRNRLKDAKDIDLIDNYRKKAK